MSDDMAKAVFHAPFNFDRRPKFAVAFSIQPSPEPQSFPRDVIDAAIAAGAAEQVKPKKRKPGNHPEADQAGPQCES